MPSELAAIEKQIGDLQARKKKLLEGARREAPRQVRETIARFGFTAGELGLAPGARKAAPAPQAKRKVPPKFANPANPAQTWSGRGVPPRWLAEQLAKGARKDDFLIVKP